MQFCLFLVAALPPLATASASSLAQGELHFNEIASVQGVHEEPIPAPASHVPVPSETFFAPTEDGQPPIEAFLPSLPDEPLRKTVHLEDNEREKAVPLDAEDEEIVTLPEPVVAFAQLVVDELYVNAAVAAEAELALCQTRLDFASRFFQMIKDQYEGANKYGYVDRCINYHLHRVLIEYEGLIAPIQKEIAEVREKAGQDKRLLVALTTQFLSGWNSVDNVLHVFVEPLLLIDKAIFILRQDLIDVSKPEWTYGVQIPSIENSAEKIEKSTTSFPLAVAEGLSVVPFCSEDGLITERLLDDVNNAMMKWAESPWRDAYFRKWGVLVGHLWFFSNSLHQRVFQWGHMSEEEKLKLRKMANAILNSLEVFDPTINDPDPRIKKYIVPELDEAGKKKIADNIAYLRKVWK